MDFFLHHFDLFILLIARRVARIQLQPIERTFARQRLPLIRRAPPVGARHIRAPAQQRQQRDDAQRVVVVHVFVTEDQTKHALSYQFLDREFNRHRITMINKTSREITDEVLLTFAFAQQQRAAVRSNLPAIKRRRDGTAPWS